MQKGTLVKNGISYSGGNSGGGSAGNYLEKENPVGTGSLSLNRKANTTIGLNSVALGYNTQATARESFAEGDTTKATGIVSHAEGFNTTASGEKSHAEGSESEASGWSSHAEGTSKATGSTSHAEGGETTASGLQSHAEGCLTLASGTGSHAEGYGKGNDTTYRGAAGNYSHTEGQSTEATNTGAHAEGYLTIASGVCAHSEGYSSVSDGTYTHAEGSSYASVTTSHSEGLSIPIKNSNVYYTKAENDNVKISVSGKFYDSQDKYQYYSISFLNKPNNFPQIEIPTLAIFDTSDYNYVYIYKKLDDDENGNKRYEAFAAGNASLYWWDNNCTLKTLVKNVEGALGRYTHSEGQNCKALHNGAHAEGCSTFAASTYTHAEGEYTSAIGTSSHSEGTTTKAYGFASHTEGDTTITKGHAAHAEGYHTTASGTSSHSEGNYTTASGVDSHAEGNHTEATGLYSHSEGYYCNATGECSHAEGFNTSAKGSYSHTSGKGTIANSIYQTVIGRYNEETSESEDYYYFIIGNGTGTENENRSNALKVNKNGDLYIAGTLKDMNGNSLLPSSSSSVKSFICNKTENVILAAGGVYKNFTTIAGPGVNLTRDKVLSINVRIEAVVPGNPYDIQPEFTSSVTFMKGDTNNTNWGHIYIKNNSDREWTFDYYLTGFYLE